MLPSLETHSLHLVPCYLVEIQMPLEDVERIMTAVGEVTSLRIGAYDNNAFQSAPGIERYRPRDGAVAGVEAGTRQRPGVVAITFQIDADQALLARLTEAVFQIHSYQEPTILVREALASRSKGLDDRDNPNRWWNTTGDWAKKA